MFKRFWNRLDKPVTFTIWDWIILYSSFAICLELIVVVYKILLVVEI